MPSKKTQYIIVPAGGLIAAENNPQQMQFFQSMQQTFSSTNQVHRMSTHTGMLPVKVVDSIGENKAKVVECEPGDLAALRASHPSVRILPVVYLEPAVMKYKVGLRLGAATAGTTAKSVAKPGAITITITSATDGKPVAGAKVVAFTDFAARAGAEGTTNASGKVALALGGSSKKIERLYVYPTIGFWPGLRENFTLKNGAKIPLQPIDLTFTDCVRNFYGGDDLTFGRGVTVGVIDSGIALNHANLVVSGGQNTVTNEKPTDFGDNGGEGHGTHVAGIIAARGTPPKGIRGVAPGVVLRSYRVFGKGAPRASNFSIAKAIDAAVADG